jgi:hypothetical protein
MPTAQLMSIVQPRAKLIAVLRDPVERTYSDFRFFFHCGVGPLHFDKKCPDWWPYPYVRDLLKPAVRFHTVVELEIQQWKGCLRKLRRDDRAQARHPRHRGDSGDSGEDDGEEGRLLSTERGRLDICKHREDLNRGAKLNKCYSGRLVLSIYAAFLVDWLAYFPGDQVGSILTLLKANLHFLNIVTENKIQIMNAARCRSCWLFLSKG